MLRFGSGVPAVFLAAACMLAANPTWAQKRVSVELVASARQAEIAGSITGEAFVDYVFSAEAGETLSLFLFVEEGMTTTVEADGTISGSFGSGTIFYQIFAPGDAGTPISDTYPSGFDEAFRTLDQSGDYTVRVYQADVASDDLTTFTLNISVE
jgi:hypothetical protein